MGKKKLSDDIKKETIKAEKPIGEITEDAYVRFGGYVNNNRHLPRVIDGLKVSYRRLLHSALSFPVGKDIPSNTLINNMANTHPHGLVGVEGTVRAFVKSGIFDGDGNFGEVYIDGTEAAPAAPRYTKIRISDTYRKLLSGLINEVHWSESPAGSLEPDYIPVPLPICLLMAEKVSGLGVGIKTDLPCFSAKSLYEAYIKNDPNLLEPSIRIGLDKENSQLAELWTKGKARLTYYYYLTREKSPDGKTEGVLFTGDTGMFTVSLKKFDKLVEEGKVTIDNVSDQSGTKLLISRVPGARGITIEDIEKLCVECCSSTVQYTLNVSDGASAFRIPLYDWLDYTYKNYITLVNSVNGKKISAVDFEIRVQEALPAVVDYILKKNPGAPCEEISGALGIPLEIVEGVMAKSIGTLNKRRDDSDKILKDLKKKLATLKKFNAVKFTSEVIQGMI